MRGKNRGGKIGENKSGRIDKKYINKNSIDIEYM